MNKIAQRIKRTLSVIMISIIIEIYVFGKSDVFATYYVFSGKFASGYVTYRAVSGSNASYANIARNCWNNISSNVSIIYYTGTNTNDIDLAANFNKLQEPTAGQLGITFLYNDGGLVDTSSIWTKANCIQYNSNSFENEGQKLKTCVHEIGHALSMAHPGDASIDSVMKQGLRNSYALTIYDKACLIYKWGGGSVC